jgi:hypothetical protein
VPDDKIATYKLLPRNLDHESLSRLGDVQQSSHVRENHALRKHVRSMISICRTRSSPGERSISHHLL